MGSVQPACAARVPGLPAEDATTGQVAAPRVKLAEIDGSLPVEGMGKVSTALPAFTTEMVLGLSLLVEPTTTEAKLRCEASARSSFNTRLLSVSAM